MAVAVFGQLDRVLRERNMTLGDLQNQIADQFQLDVDLETLEQLLGTESLRHTDLTIVAAVASSLNVSLDELLLVVTPPADDTTIQAQSSLLNEEETRRLWQLQDLQDVRDLTEHEQHELDDLTLEYGRRLMMSSQHEEATRRGVSLDQVQQEDEQRLAEAAKYSEWLDADPKRHQARIDYVKRRAISATG